MKVLFGVFDVLVCTVPPCYKMASTTSSTTSVGPTVSFSGTPVITSKKLSGSKLSWSASVELWFLGQGHHDHLEKDFTKVPAESQEQ